MAEPLRRGMARPQDRGMNDPRARRSITLDEDAVQNHRQIYVGIHMPIKRHRSRHKRKHKENRDDKGNESFSNGPTSKEKIPTDSVPPPKEEPSEKVKDILGGEERVEGFDHHELFTELEEFCCGEDGIQEWKETARWFKFEEDVEAGGDRWSKPHVATLSLYSLFEVRTCFMAGSVLLDLDVQNLQQIADHVLNDLISRGQLEEENRMAVRSALLKRHVHQGSRKFKRRGTMNIPSLPSFARKLSSAGMEMSTIGESGTVQSDKGSNLPAVMEDMPSEADHELDKFDSNLAKRLPPGAEASNVLVGEVNFLDRPIIAFVRLANAVFLGDLTEVPIPTRFMFIMLGPSANAGGYHEVGRAVSAVIADDMFHDVAYIAKTRQDLLAAIDTFLQQVTVLPPGEWDPSIRIEPPQNVPSRDNRMGTNGQKEETNNKPDEKDGGVGNGQIICKGEHRQRMFMGRCFSGLAADMHRKCPTYFQECKEALNIQCVSSVLFIYFAVLTFICLYGEQLESKTDSYLGKCELMLGTCVSGIIFSLMGGQPLILLMVSLPLIYFDGLLYDFCEYFSLEYLPFRLWIGFWTMIFCFAIAIKGYSVFVQYVTRFTEEIYVMFMALDILVIVSQLLDKIYDKYPIRPQTEMSISCACYQDVINVVPTMDNGTWLNNTVHNLTRVSVPIMDCEASGFMLVGNACGENIFLLSLVLAMGTFILACGFNKLKRSAMFGATFRIIVADFGVFIAAILMTVVDVIYQVNTPKLILPDSTIPTSAVRGTWTFSAFGTNAKWTMAAAVIPGFLLSILVFIDQHITGVIVNRREHKLRRGSAYHLDIAVVGFIFGVCSWFGFPFMVGATVLSLNHTVSLFVLGPRKRFYVAAREQRITGLVIAILVGFSFRFAPVLKYIPLPVMYGILLYMGLLSLYNNQFFERIRMLVTPIKYQPEVMYLREVSMPRIHLFTLTQIGCLVLMFAVAVTPAKIIFPLMVLMLVVVRKLLERVFGKFQLLVLDDAMPEWVRRKDFETDDEEEEESSSDKDEEAKKLQAMQLNIEEEVARTSLWKHLVSDTGLNNTTTKKKKRHRHHHHHHHHKHKHKHKPRSSRRKYLYENGHDVAKDTIVEVDDHPETSTSPLISVRIDENMQKKPLDDSPSKSPQSPKDIEKGL